MKTAVFSTKSYDREFLSAANPDACHELVFVENRLRTDTVGLAAGCAAVCAFVNDVLDAPVLKALHETGTRFIVMRCAGYNNVDLNTARSLDIKVARVPAYSPYAVAHPGRRVDAPRELPQRPRHQPPSLFHQRGHDQHRHHHDVQSQRLRIRSALP